MKNLLIIDVDGVLLSFKEDTLSYIRNKSGKSFTTWHELNQVIPDYNERQSFIKDFSASDLFGQMKGIPGAREALRLLQEEASIEIMALTSSWVDNMSLTRRRENLIQEVGWRENDPIVMLPLNSAKDDALKSIYELNGTGLLIDDSLKNINSACNANHHFIHFKTKEDQEAHERILKNTVHTWDGIIERLKQFKFLPQTG